MSSQDEREYIRSCKIKPKLIDVKYEPLGCLEDGFNCIETYVRWVPSVAVDIRDKFRENMKKVKI